MYTPNNHIGAPDRNSPGLHTLSHPNSKGQSVLTEEDRRPAVVARSFASPIALGESVVRCHGIDTNDAPVLVAQNFIPGLRYRGGPPIQIDATPQDNKSTNLLAIPCLGKREIALTTTPPPGLVEYYKDRGLLESVDQVISVNADRRKGDHMGLPYCDPVSQALRSFERIQSRIPADAFFVSAFTSPHIREQVENLGLRVIQRSDAFLSNNKTEFRKAAERYGFRVCPGMDLNSERDIVDALVKYRNIPMWMKFSHSFGGDLLAKIEPPMTLGAIHAVRDRMWNSFQKATEVNHYEGVSLEDLWPTEQFAPNHFGIVLEADASLIGRPLLIGSNLMEVAVNGEVQVRSYFEQIIGSDGTFMGSRSFKPGQRFGADLFSDLESQCQAIGRYCAEELELYGLVGVDFILVQEHESGRVVPVMIELNGRPPISACSLIVGSQKLEAQSWISRYAWAPEPLITFDDFEKTFTVDNHNFARSSASEGAVIPMYLSSSFNRDSAGNYELIEGKRWMQILIAGPTDERCHEISEILQARKGISFTSPTSW